MRTRFNVRRGTNNKKIMCNEQYDALESHLRSGWSFWSAAPKMGIGIGFLERLNRTDLRVKDIRWRWDSGRYRTRGTSLAKTGVQDGSN